MFKPGLFSSVIFVVFVLILFSCKTTINLNDALLPVAQEDVPDPILIPLDSSHSCYEGLKNRTAVTEFYKRWKGNPTWIDKQNNLNALSDSMILFVNKIGYYGLVPEDYLFSEIYDAREENLSAIENLLRIETQLTDAFMSICSDLNSGRHSQGSKFRDSVGIYLLTQAIGKNGIKESLESQEPQFADYKSLKEVLKVLIDSLTNGSKVDSTRVAGKVQSVNVNLDRWRKEKTSFGRRYVYINIPSFMLRVIENDTVIFSSKVIVGSVETPTPDISSVIECFTTYPYWHVPRKIALDEYLPVIQNDTTFLTRNNFDVLDRKGKVLNPDSINWAKYHKNYFPIVLRQREGEENSLGIIKFVFDNPYAIYVHDTNAKKLFRSSTRAFSHGCIRMEKAS
jgi:murein L,D-transpeptidase YcbB/YkuD